MHTLHGPWTDESRLLYELVGQHVHLVAISDAQRAATREAREIADEEDRVAPACIEMRDVGRTERQVHVADDRESERMFFGFGNVRHEPRA